jgi:ATPase subunit of ABC transporter with duplicated ATPase domains
LIYNKDTMIKNLTVKDLTHQFDNTIIFNSISFSIKNNEKICIVGENGAGKSTLLKIINKDILPRDGQIVYNQHIRTHYIPQEFPQQYLQSSVEDFIHAQDGTTLLKKIFQYGTIFNFIIEEFLEFKCASLSGGQQKILMISIGLAKQPDFLLLDEPENHLDIVTRLELVNILQEYRSGILFISHDRLLIDALATKVLEIEKQSIFISEGGYEDYCEARSSRIFGMQKEYDTDIKRIKKLEIMLPILHQKAFRGKDVSMYLQRKEELSLLKSKLKENPRAKDTHAKINLQKNTTGLHHGKLLCKISNIAYQYPNNETKIFYNCSLELRTGNHIVLVGRNGSGKSTFLKTIMGTLQSTQGTVDWAENISITYFDQHAEFDPEKTANQIVDEEINIPNMNTGSILGSMRFTSEKMNSKIKNLSGGERMRLRFALTFIKQPDVIILDEPTNHLDETTWQVLLETCNTTQSTIILVTHDYEFIQKIDNKIFWVIHRQEIKERHKDLDIILEELQT